MPIRNKEKLDALAAKLANVPTSAPEYKNWMQRLDEAAQSGNKEAKYTLDKTIEYATANRKGYDGLQEFAMAATTGVPGISGFVGSKVGEKYGTVGSIVGGVLGGLVGASHDVMNIGRQIKYNSPDFRNITINGKSLNLSQKRDLYNTYIRLGDKSISKIVNNSNLGYYVPEDFFSGTPNKIDDIRKFDGDIWLSGDKDVYTYFSNRDYPGSPNITNKFQAGYRKNEAVKEFDFGNNGFRGQLDSDEIVRDNNENVIKMNNIIELKSPSTNIVIPKSVDRLIIPQKEKYKYFDFDWLKFMLK